MNPGGRSLLSLLGLLLAATPVAWAAWAEQSTPPPTHAGPSASVMLAPRVRLEAAGSGANIAITRLLVEELSLSDALHIHDSVGSSGGLRALQDGRIDIALLSRPLKPSDGPLVAVPYARTELGFGFHESERAPSSLGELISTTASGASRWHLLLREEGDSGMQVLSREHPELFGMLRGAEDNGLEVIYRDQDMVDALAATEGALGLSDRGQVHLRGNLAFLPVSPPSHRILYLAFREEHAPRLQDVVAALVSTNAKEVLERHGYGAPEGLPRHIP